jgi:5-aminolevulinate synthase
MKSIYYKMKGFGVFGGYIAGNKFEIDCIRSFAPNFIFTTSLPPCIAAASQASIAFLKNRHDLRESLHETAKLIKNELEKNDIPVYKNPSHIIPIFIGDAVKAKLASDMLIKEFKIYLQPINFPTVNKGEEILRISPTPNHTQEMVDKLVQAL